MLEEPHRLVAELLRGERRVEMEMRIEGTERDTIHPYAAVAELERQRLGEADERGLHRAVDREPGRGPMRFDRGDVDHRRPAVGRHERHRGAHEVGDAREVLTYEGILA